MKELADPRMLWGLGLLIFFAIWTGVLDLKNFKPSDLIPSSIRSRIHFGQQSSYTSWSSSTAADIVPEGRSVRSLQTDHLYRNVPPQERERLLKRLQAFEEERRQAEEAKNRTAPSNNIPNPGV